MRPTTSGVSRDSADQRAAAISTLVEREAGSLLDYFRRRTSCAEDASDLLGDTLLVVWRRAISVPVDPTHARMWLFGVARKVLSAHRRSTGRRTALAQRLVAMIEIVEVGGEDEASEQVRRLVESLAEPDREIVKLVYWDGFSLVEVAQILEMKPVTVRSRHRRATARLRAALDSAGPRVAEVTGWASAGANPE